MRISIYPLATAVALLATAGCNKAQSPADVQYGVTAAATSAADNNARAGEKLADATNAADKDLGAATKTADEKMAAASADAAITAAEGQHKIATAKCEAMAGDAQKACKDEADAALDMARAKAKASTAKSS